MNNLGKILLILLFYSSAHGEWKIDFSRRQQDIVEYEKQRKISSEEKRSFLDMVFERQKSQQEIVIMHSDLGFSPQTLQVRKNQRYKVHVVNVSSKTKNVSFMLDAFSQHHGTFYAEPVSFIIEPRKEGLYHFQCPETSAKGQLVVTGLKNPVDNPLKRIEQRQPASH